MTLVKAGSKLQETGTKKVIARNTISQSDTTPKIIWFLVKRHKVGLLATWAVVITTLYLCPFIPHMLFSALMGY